MTAIARLLDRAPAPWSVTARGNVIDANEVIIDPREIAHVAAAFPSAWALMRAAVNGEAQWRPSMKALLERLENAP